MIHLRSFVAVLLSIAALVQSSSASAASSFHVEGRREAFMSGGRRIKVETFAPKAAGRFPAVLVLHSSAGTLLGKGELERFSRALAAQGAVALLVRYFDRTGTVWASNDDIEKLPPLWIETVQHAVDFAASHPRVRADAIGIFGYSLGAYIAVAESSRDRRVDAVAEVAGGIFQGFRGRMQRVPPMLILHGRADRRVPAARAFELAKTARQLGPAPTVKIYDGEGHVLSRSAMEDATVRALRFFATHLESSPTEEKKRPSLRSAPPSRLRRLR